MTSLSPRPRNICEGIYLYEYKIVATFLCCGNECDKKNTWKPSAVSRHRSNAVQPHPQCLGSIRRDSCLSLACSFVRDEVPSSGSLFRSPLETAIGVPPLLQSKYVEFVVVKNRRKCLVPSRAPLGNSSAPREDLPRVCCTRRL